MCESRSGAKKKIEDCTSFFERNFYPFKSSILSSYAAPDGASCLFRRMISSSTNRRLLTEPEDVLAGFQSRRDDHFVEDLLIARIELR